jgi:protein gp37
MESSSIAWTDATWNPWHGCQKISPGCKHGYMYRDKQRYGQDPTQVVRSKTTFHLPRRWREPRRIFTCSWSDFFIEQADPWRAEAWEIIRDTPQHTSMILTKRADRIADHVPAGWPWPHVWLGVSVESQACRWRVDVVRTIPAAVRFLSCEPLLQDLGQLDLRGIDWVIVGGESGPTYRPMQARWARSLRDQCVANHVAFFYKQGAGAKPGNAPYLEERDGSLWEYHQWPDQMTPPVQVWSASNHRKTPRPPSAF